MHVILSKNKIWTDIQEQVALTAIATVHTGKSQVRSRIGGIYQACSRKWERGQFHFYMYMKTGRE